MAATVREWLATEVCARLPANMPWCCCFTPACKLPCPVMQSVMGERRPNCVIIDEIDGATGGSPGMGLHLRPYNLHTGRQANRASMATAHMCQSGAAAETLSKSPAVLLQAAPRGAAALPPSSRSSPLGRARAASSRAAAAGARRRLQRALQTMPTATMRRQQMAGQAEQSGRAVAQAAAAPPPPPAGGPSSGSGHSCGQSSASATTCTRPRCARCATWRASSISRSRRCV